jgi:anti-sigma factor RsiW
VKVDHQSAVDRDLAERYALGELEASELAEFEEHLFGCAVCAEDVREIARLAANMKAVLREEDEHQ